MHRLESTRSDSADAQR